MTAADDRAALPQWTEDDIARIIGTTNFDQIRAAMLAVGWTYGYEKETPSVERLIVTARRILESGLETWRAGEFDRSTCASGGFYAHFGRDDAGLEFVLSTTTIDETGYCYAV